MRSNLTGPESVIAGGQPVRITGRSAISNAGDLIVYPASGGPHATDVWLTQRNGTNWSTPVLLTADSTESYSDAPVLSRDETRVLFGCGPTPYQQQGNNACEVGVDGTGFLKVVDSRANPTGARGVSTIQQGDYATTGALVFESDWNGGEQVWSSSNGQFAVINNAYDDDNSPCVLPGGRVVSLWLGRPDGNGLHELKVMDLNGDHGLVFLPGVDVVDAGYSCSGK
jgi:hypothetical protein